MVKIIKEYGPLERAFFSPENTDYSVAGNVPQLCCYVRFKSEKVGDQFVGRASNKLFVSGRIVRVEYGQSVPDGTDEAS
eukprot:3312516-Lingulodinium_polyedra.AAC.1